MSKLTVVRHPLIDHKMAIIRDKTNTKDFKKQLVRLGCSLLI